MASYSNGTPPEGPQIPQAAVLRRFALFMDGMARGMLLPFGPELIYGILYQTQEITPSTWSSISLRLAFTISAFLVGHSAGATAADQLQPFVADPQQKHVIVARLGGLAIGLHFFSWGAGVSSVFFLALIRFLYALVAGILCAITEPPPPQTQQSTDYSAMNVDPLLAPTNNSPTTQESVFAPANAKIYLAGFAVSTLSGGLFFHAVSKGDIFHVLMGTYMISPFFLLGITVLGEVLLRGAFAMTAQPEGFRRILRRVVEGKRVSFKKVQNDEDETERLLHGGLRRRASSRESFATDTSDVFFDCNSDLSEDGGNSISGKLDDGKETAKYKGRICCYADGSPAFVPPGDCTTIVPANYLEDCGGNRNKAMKMWQETQKWRRERNVWKIHRTPNTFYYDIRKAYPHCAHGYSKEGLAVIYEQPGKMNLRALFQGECSIDDMVHHYIFFNEYLSSCLCASEELRRVAGLDGVPYDSSGYGIIVVMDIQGAGISMLSTDVIKYLTTVSAINQAYYPRSMKRVCVVNCPFWASGVFQTIKKILPASVKADLFSNNCIEGLRQYIDDEQIPPEYGGSSPYKFGEHPFAIKLNELVDLAAKGDIEENVVPKVVSSTPIDMPDEKQQKQPKQKEPAQEKIDPSSGNPDSSIRRRAVSPLPNSEEPADKPAASRAMEKEVVGVDSLAFVSFFCAFWSGLQGAIEVALPLWLSSPVRFGGLGYSPSTNGITLFCVSAVLLSMLTTSKVDGMMSRSRTNPIRALRRGLGMESIVLFLLALIPLRLSMEESTSTISVTVVSCLGMGAFATLLGRSGASCLGQIVSDGLSQHLLPVLDRSSASILSADYLIAECTSGRAARFLSLIAEVVGILVNSQIWALSIDRERPSKYDGTLFLFIPSVIAGFLYFLSHFLQLKPSEGALSSSFGIGDIENNVSPRKAA